MHSDARQREADAGASLPEALFAVALLTVAGALFTAIVLILPSAETTARPGSPANLDMLLRHVEQSVGARAVPNEKCKSDEDELKRSECLIAVTDTWPTPVEPPPWGWNSDAMTSCSTPFLPPDDYCVDPLLRPRVDTTGWGEASWPDSSSGSGRTPSPDFGEFPWPDMPVCWLSVPENPDDTTTDRALECWWLDRGAHALHRDIFVPTASSGEPVDYFMPAATEDNDPFSDDLPSSPATTAPVHWDLDTRYNVVQTGVHSMAWLCSAPTLPTPPADTSAGTLSPINNTRLADWKDSWLEFVANGGLQASPALPDDLQFCGFWDEQTEVGTAVLTVCSVMSDSDLERLDPDDPRVDWANRHSDGASADPRFCIPELPLVVLPGSS